VSAPPPPPSACAAELRRRGITAAGSHTYSIAGNIMDAAGIAQALRLQVSGLALGAAASSAACAAARPGAAEPAGSPMVEGTHPGSRSHALRVAPTTASPLKKALALPPVPAAPPRCPPRLTYPGRALRACILHVPGEHARAPGCAAVAAHSCRMELRLSRCLG